MPISVGRTAAAIIGALAAFLIVDRLLTGNLSDWNYIRLYNYDVSTVPGNSAHAHDPQPAAPPAFDLETKPLKRPSAVFSEKDVDDVQLKASSYTVCIQLTLPSQNS